MNVFQIIVTLFIFNIKNVFNTKTTCSKCSFDYLHWLLIYGKLYQKYGVLLAVHTSGASPQSSASHLLTFLVAQLQFIREWKLSDRRLYEVYERRLLIWGNPKERNRIQIPHFKNMRSFCATLYIQQDATLHILFISGNCSTCFGWYHHPSSGAHTMP
jgi:hypothetical protein